MRKKIRNLIQMFFSELFTANLLLSALGWLAKMVYGDRLTTVALFYPANKKYIDSVAFPWYARRVRWRPTFGGFFVTSRGCGFIFAIGALEEEFSDPANRQHLLKVHEAMERVAGKLRVKTAYSGVLPSVLARAGIDREPIELVRTAHWIVEAVDAVRKDCKLPSTCPIVVLGAAGYLGRRVVNILARVNPEQLLVEIDPAHEDSNCHGYDVLEKFHGTPILVVNISRRDVMERYLGALWEGVVILNEVYPECSAEGLVQAKEKGIRYFHIQGVEAWSVPKFPGAYKGAVPCCAASAANADSVNNLFHAKLKLLEK